MKKFKAISKSKVTFDIPSKACALVLGIMLAVTGIMPSLAANNIGVKKNKSISSVKQEKSEIYNLSRLEQDLPLPPAADDPQDLERSL